MDAEFGASAHGLRLDSGVADGVGGRRPLRPDARQGRSPTAPTGPRRRALLADALARARIHGADHQPRPARARAAAPGVPGRRHDTGFLDRHPATGRRSPAARPHGCPRWRRPSPGRRPTARPPARGVLGGLPSGWRNVPSQPQRAVFRAEDGGRLEIAYRLTRDGLRAEGFDDVALVAVDPGRVVLETAGLRHAFEVAAYHGVRPGAVHVDSPLGPVRLTPVERLPEPAARVTPGALPAPMPGTVLRVEVKPGDVVEAGQPVVVLEAMKMEHLIVSPASGTVAALHVTPGAQVEAGVPLAVIEPSPPGEPDGGPHTEATGTAPRAHDRAPRRTQPATGPGTGSTAEPGAAAGPATGAGSDPDRGDHPGADGRPETSPEPTPETSAAISPETGAAFSAEIGPEIGPEVGPEIGREIGANPGGEATQP